MASQPGVGPLNKAFIVITPRSFSDSFWMELFDKCSDLCMRNTSSLDVLGVIKTLYQEWENKFTSSL